METWARSREKDTSSGLKTRNREEQGTLFYSACSFQSVMTTCRLSSTPSRGVSAEAGKTGECAKEGAKDDRANGNRFPGW